jgi:hypothetical protein
MFAIPLIALALPVRRVDRFKTANAQRAFPA